MVDIDALEFQRILKLGLGRAFLHLQKHDATPYREAILYTCLHDTTYDSQVEGGKTLYLMEILELTNDMDFYRRHILDAARKVVDDSRDTEHILGMVYQFAADDDQEARQLLYDLFATRLSTESLAVLIIQLDQFQGFLFVADKLGEQALQDPEFVDGDYLLVMLEEEVGKEQCAELLSQARQENPRMNAYVKVMEECRQRYKKRETRFF